MPAKRKDAPPLPDPEPTIRGGGSLILDSGIDDADAYEAALQQGRQARALEKIAAWDAKMAYEGRKQPVQVIQDAWRRLEESQLGHALNAPDRIAGLIEASPAGLTRLELEVVTGYSQAYMGTLLRRLLARGRIAAERAMRPDCLGRERPRVLYRKVASTPPAGE